MSGRNREPGTRGPVKRGRYNDVQRGADVVTPGISLGTTLTGDVTGSGSGTFATTIANDAVTFAKMQNLTTDRLIGRDTAGTGNPEEISVSGGVEFSGSTSIRRSALTGDVTAAAGSNATTIANNAVSFAKFQAITTDRLLGADTGTAVEEIPLAGGLEFTGGPGLRRSALTGDVTASAGNNATTIANDAVTFAKFQNLTTDRLVGRDTAGTGDVEEISVGGGLEFTGSAGIQRSALTGDVTATAGSGATTIANNAVTTAKILDAAVTLAKLADLANSKIIARKTAGTGVPEACSLSDVLDLVGSAAQGDILIRGAATWTRLGAGTSGYFLQTLGAAANPAWASAAIGGGSIYSGSGHPQGVQAAAIGSLYQDTATGYLYRKEGGASTAYGWYLEARMTGSGPIWWRATPANNVATTAAFTASSSHGPFSDGAGTAMFTGANTGTQSRQYISGKLYVQSAGVATNGTTGEVRAPNTNAIFALDDDIDLWIDMRTGGVITVARIWFGLTSANILDTATLGSGSNGSIAFRYSTADGGNTTDWLGATQLNGAGNQSLSTSMGAVGASTNYRLRLRFIRQTATPIVYFSVNDGTEVSLTTNIPATGSIYFPSFACTTKENVSKAILWRQWGAQVGS